MRRASGFARIAAGIFGIGVLYAHLIYSLGAGGSALPNFFSYFTMHSAMAAVLLWIVGGVLTIRRPLDPQWIVTVRMLLTCYQLVSGVVYSIIVAQGVALGVSIQVPLTSQILHYWMPAFALVDWLTGPGHARVTWRALSLVLAFPLAWGAFTMIRGAVIGWYPYFFLDPHQVSGPVEFAAYCSIVLAFIIAVAALLVLASRFLPRPWSVLDPRGSARAGSGRGGSARGGSTRRGSTRRGSARSGQGERAAGAAGSAPDGSGTRGSAADGSGTRGSAQQEGFEAAPGGEDELVVAEVGKRRGTLAPDESHEDR